MTVETVPSDDRLIVRRVVVNAPAAEIFAMLDDPHRHHELDGSGTVKEKVKGPHALHEGDRFTVAMKQFGVPYKITSTVVAHAPGRLIEWRHPAGHTWRWELDEATPGTTTVTETWDASHTPAYTFFKLAGMTGKNAQGIEQTLEGLQRRYA